MFQLPITDMACTTTATEYRILGSRNTSTVAPLMERTQCVKEWAMVSYDQLVMLNPDTVRYLQDEAKRRGVPVEEVYQEEAVAKAELTAITPRNAVLLNIADRFPAPQSWYDE